MKKIQDVLVNVKDPTRDTSIQKNYTGFAVIKPGRLCQFIEHF